MRDNVTKANKKESDRTKMAMVAPSSVKDVRLSAKQEALLHSLERRVQLRAQAESNALLMQQHSDDDPSAVAAAATMKEFLSRRVAGSAIPHAAGKEGTAATGTNGHALAQFALKVDACAADWTQLFSHAHGSFALVEEMEASHAQVASKTQALYDSFENVLQQVEALNTRVDVIAAPMPHFTAIDRIAHTLGFGVKFAAPSSTSSSGGGSTVGTNANSHTQQPVQVFQHKRNIDPTTAAFEDALEKIDASVAYLEHHVRIITSTCGCPIVSSVFQDTVS